MFDWYGTLGAGPSHVSKSRCAGGASGLALPIEERLWLFHAFATSTRPIAPLCSSSIARCTCRVLRDWVPTCMTRLLRRATSIISRPSRTLCEHGFST